MSKIAKTIDSKVSHCSVGRKYMNVRTDVSSTIPTPGLEVCVSMVIMKHAVVPPDVDPKDAIKDIKRVIIEEVFGEFRPLIYDMRTALYGGNKADLRKMLGELEDAMFHDGV